jgi:hypothetical protein
MGEQSSVNPRTPQIIVVPFSFLETSKNSIFESSISTKIVPLFMLEKHELLASPFFILTSDFRLHSDSADAPAHRAARAHSAKHWSGRLRHRLRFQRQRCCLDDDDDDDDDDDGNDGDDDSGGDDERDGCWRIRLAAVSASTTAAAVSATTSAAAATAAAAAVEYESLSHCRRSNRGSRLSALVSARRSSLVIVVLVALIIIIIISSSIFVIISVIVLLIVVVAIHAHLVGHDWCRPRDAAPCCPVHDGCLSASASASQRSPGMRAYHICALHVFGGQNIVSKQLSTRVFQ